MKIQILKYGVVGIFLATSVAHSAPPPGHPSVNDANEVLGIQADQTALPYKGVVVETIHSNNYTYIQVDTNGRKNWLAAPKVELENGTTIMYGDGAEMTDFYSKVHKRTFDHILFIGGVKKVTD